MEPTLVWEKSISLAAEEITENVVPKDVADNAAPMINVSTGPAWCQTEALRVDLEYSPYPYPK